MPGAPKVALLGEGARSLEPALAAAGAQVVADDADVAVGVGVDGALALADVRAARKVRLALDASAADALDVPVIATTEWAAELLRALRPEVMVLLVRPGLERTDAPERRRDADGPLRVKVVAGEEALAEMMEWREAVEEGADVLLDLSREPVLVEPALAAGLAGAAAVVTAAPGREEVVHHGEDGMVVGWDDTRGAARTLDLLARDRALLRRLQDGARARSEAWPATEDSGRGLLAAFEQLPEVDEARLSAQAAEIGRAGREIAVSGAATTTRTVTERPRLRRLKRLVGGR